MAKSDGKTKHNLLLASLLAPGVEYPVMLDDMDRLKLAYADAMWAWAHVEAGWFRVYIGALNAYRETRFRALQQSYFSVVSANTRLDITNAAAAGAWGPKDTGKGNKSDAEIKTWNDLAKRSKAELVRRGRIAHLTGANARPGSNESPRLVQHFWHPKSEHFAKNQPVISVDDLRDMTKTWEQLSIEIEGFAIELDALAGLPAPPSPPPPPTSGPDSPPQSPTSRSPTEPEPPPQSSPA